MSRSFEVFEELNLQIDEMSDGEEGEDGEEQWRGERHELNDVSAC